MIDRPQNWATREARAKLFPSPVSPPPKVSLEMADWLRRMFPPVCYDPTRERLEDHLLYAGRVSLAAELLSFAERQAQRDEALAALADDTDPEANAIVVLPREEP